VSRSSAIRNVATANTSHADTHSGASGGHLPQRDAMAATVSARTRKGRQLPDGSWGPDTRAMDGLIGAWDEFVQERMDGCGMHAVAVMAWRLDRGTPMVSTVNDKPGEGGGLLIDWLLVTDAMQPHVIPDSYRLHLPDARYRPPFDSLPPASTCSGHIPMFGRSSPAMTVHIEASSVAAAPFRPGRCGT
jgi:hypothetical protein